MNAPLETCTRLCCETRQECLGAMQACLKAGGKLADANLSLKLAECMRQAQLAADCCTTESEVCASVCTACAEACEDCARACDAMAEPLTARCAGVLRRCAEACRAVGGGGSELRAGRRAPSAPARP